MNTKNVPQLLLRVGLAFVFIFASIEIFINPLSLIEYTPPFILGIVPQDIFMYSFAIFEILLAVWLLSGKKLLIPSIVAALSMLMIVVFNLDRFNVLFRNIAIMCAALSLASMNWKDLPIKKKTGAPSTDMNNPEQKPATPTTPPATTPPPVITPSPTQNS